MRTHVWRYVVLGEFLLIVFVALISYSPNANSLCGSGWNYESLVHPLQIPSTYPGTNIPYTYNCPEESSSSTADILTPIENIFNVYTCFYLIVLTLIYAVVHKALTRTARKKGRKTVHAN